MATPFFYKISRKRILTSIMQIYKASGLVINEVDTVTPCFVLSFGQIMHAAG